MRVTANQDGSFSLSSWNGSAWGPLNGGASYSYRNDGWWWSNDAPISYRFDVVSGPDASGQPYRYRYLMLRGSRQEKRRVRNECVSTCRSRGSPDLTKNKRY